jgi:hypothetical protein
MTQPPDLEARENTRVLNAMREDLTDLRTRVDDGFAVMENRLTDMQSGFIEMRGRLDAAAAGQQQIVSLLNTLIDQDEDQ